MILWYKGDMAFDPKYMTRHYSETTKEELEELREKLRRYSGSQNRKCNEKTF